MRDNGAGTGLQIESGQGETIRQQASISSLEAFSPPVISAAGIQGNIGSNSSVHIGTVIGQQILLPPHHSAPGAAAGASSTSTEAAVSIQSLKAQLKSVYAAQPGIPLLMHEALRFAPHELYVELELLAGQKEKKRRGEEGESSDDPAAELEERLARRREFEINPTTRQAIKPEQLFQAIGDQPASKRVWLEGSAGAGKTTLCKYLAYRWATSTEAEPFWPEFEIVIYLPLREVVKAYPKDGVVGQSPKPKLEQFLTGRWDEIAVLNTTAARGRALITETDKTNLWTFIDSHPDKVLFLLDGYDEVREPDSTITDLLEHVPCYLLTSRPQAIPVLERGDGPKIQRQVENIGFSAAHVEEYINRYFVRVSQADKANGLKDWLKLNLNLQGLIQIPLNCQLVCSAWETGSLPNNPTMTQLYEVLMLQWQKRSLAKAQEISSDRLRHYTAKDITESCQLYMEALAELALRNLEREADVLIEGSLIYEVVESQLTKLGQALTPDNKIAFAKKMIGLGVIKAQGSSESLFDDRYEAIHLTFVEHLAADCLAKGFAAEPSSEQAKRACRILTDHQFSPRFTIVWRFVAGRLRANGSIGLKNFFYRLVADPADVLGVDLVIQSMYCLEESRLLLNFTQVGGRRTKTEIMPVEFIHRLLDWVEVWLMFSSIDPILSLRGTVQRCSACTQILLRPGRQLREWFVDKVGRSIFWNIEPFVAHLNPETRAVLVSTTQAKLSDGDRDIRARALEVLRALLPHLSADDHKAILVAAQAKLSDEEWSVRAQALVMLRALFLYVRADDRKTILVAVTLQAKLGDGMSYSRNRALEVLESLFPHLSADDHKAILVAAQARLSDKDSNVRLGAQQVLEALFPRLSAEDHKVILAAAQTKLRDEKRDVHAEALYVLEALIPHLSAEDHKAILVAARAKLSDEEWGIRAQAWQVLKVLIPRVSADDREVILVAARDKLSDEDESVRSQALRVLEALIPHLSAEDRNDISVAAQTKLRDKKRDVHAEALRVLEALIPHLSAKDRKAILVAAQVRLDEVGYARTRARAWQVLRALIPHLSAEDRKVILVAAQDRMSDEMSYVGARAWQVLEALIPHLSAEDRKVILVAAQARLGEVGYARTRTRAWQVFKALIPHLSAKDRKDILAAAKTKLSDGKSDVRTEALEVLEALIPHVSADDRKVILVAAKDRLSDEDEIVRAQALEVLEALIRHVSADDRKVILVAAKDRLSDEEKGGDVRFHALKVLKLLLPHLEDNSLLALLSQLKAVMTVRGAKSKFFVENINFFNKRLRCCNSALQPRLQAVLMEIYADIQPAEHLSLLRQLRLIVQSDLHASLQTQLGAERNRLGGQFLLSEANATVCLLHNSRKRHALLVIESMVREAGNLMYKCEFADLIYAASSRQVDIRLLAVSEDKLLEYQREHYPYKGWQITQDQLRRLKTSIERDRLQQREIRYNLMGDGSVYQIAFPGRVYHNCLSWAEAKIEELGLSLAQDWLDLIVVDPRRHLPAQEEEGQNKCCLIM